jgi:hypothetical protein
MNAGPKKGVQSLCGFCPVNLTIFFSIGNDKLALKEKYTNDTPLLQEKQETNANT